VRSPKQNIAAEIAALKERLIATLAPLVNAVSVGERGSYTLKEFQRRHNLSESQFFKLCREGKGPRFMATGSVGKRVSPEAERDWIAAREAEAEAAAKETGDPEDGRPSDFSQPVPAGRKARS
jgi:hypothetical protein